MASYQEARKEVYRRVRRACCVLIPAILVAVAGWGCAGPAPKATWAQVSRQPNPHLLFDQAPGRHYADAMPFRRQWPTADAGHALTERIEFRARFEDRQGRDDNGNRSFRRTGASTPVGRVFQPAGRVAANVRSAPGGG